MKERRKYQRYSLSVPVRIRALDPGSARALKLVSKRISAAGAFFDTEEPLPKGSRVSCELCITSEKLKQLTRTHGVIKVLGTVTRSDAAGMEIAFDRRYRISRGRDG
jgi:hypothetical protein